MNKYTILNKRARIASETIKSHENFEEVLLKYKKTKKTKKRFILIAIVIMLIAFCTFLFYKFNQSKQESAENNNSRKEQMQSKTSRRKSIKIIHDSDLIETVEEAKRVVSSSQMVVESIIEQKQLVDRKKSDVVATMEYFKKDTMAVAQTDSILEPIAEIKNTDNVVDPTPTKVVERPQIRLDILPEEFPELANHKNALFDIYSDSLFDPEIIKVDWKKIDLKKDTSNFYILQLKKGRRIETFRVKPASPK